MDKFQAAFELLYVFCVADGKIEMSEIKVIQNFLESNYGSISFDPSKIASSIDNLNPQGKIREFQRAATDFGNYGSAIEQQTLLEFAVELILSDGDISDDEKVLFQLLANYWDIDIGHLEKLLL